MATTKSRINISLPDDVKDTLEALAKRDQVPTATKAERLLELALEIEEDAVLESIAEKRDRAGVKYVPHDKAWQ